MRFRDNSQTHIPQHRHPRITIGHISGSGRTVVSVTDRRPAVLLVVKLVSRWQLFLSSTINGNSQLKEPWARIRLDPETLSRAVEKNVTVRLWSSDVFSYDVVEFWWWWWRRGLKSTWFRLESFFVWYQYQTGTDVLSFPLYPDQNLQATYEFVCIKPGRLSEPIFSMFPIISICDFYQSDCR